MQPRRSQSGWRRKCYANTSGTSCNTGESGPPQSWTRDGLEMTLMFGLRRVRLRFRCRLGKGGQSLKMRADLIEPGIRRKIAVESPSVVHLRHQTDIGKSHV